MSDKLSKTLAKLNLELPKQSTTQTLEESLTVQSNHAHQVVTNLSASTSNSKLVTTTKELTVVLNTRIPISIRKAIDELIATKSQGYNKVAVKDFVIEALVEKLTKEGYL
jgi:hypothetical protein